jgi:hypothetical protein
MNTAVDIQSYHRSFLRVREIVVGTIVPRVKAAEIAKTQLSVAVRATLSLMKALFCSDPI